MADQKTITFIITRQDGPDSSPYEETFNVPYRKKYERYIWTYGNSKEPY